MMSIVNTLTDTFFFFIENVVLHELINLEN